MAGNVKFVINRKTFEQEVLHHAVRPAISGVYATLMAGIDEGRGMKAWLNEDTDRVNAVAAAPAAVERKRGTLTRLLGSVRV